MFLMHFSAIFRVHPNRNISMHLLPKNIFKKKFLYNFLPSAYDVLRVFVNVIRFGSHSNQKGNQKAKA